MISVCMATYNGERFIKEQIDSILVQLSEDDELIISDDGSTDSTLEIINSYKDNRIRLYHHTKNPDFKNIKYCRNFYYVASNFENALNRARGDYIFLSDQDDVWYPHKVSKTLEVLKNYDICMSNFSVIDGNGSLIKDKYHLSSPIYDNYILNIVKTRYLGCCMAFNKACLDVCLPFPRALIGHESWIGILSSIKGFGFTFIKEPLVYYRRSGFNVSSGFEKSSNPIWYRVYLRIKLIYQLIKHRPSMTNFNYKNDALDYIQS